MKLFQGTTGWLRLGRKKKNKQKRLRWLDAVTTNDDDDDNGGSGEHWREH